MSFFNRLSLSSRHQSINPFFSSYLSSLSLLHTTYQIAPLDENGGPLVVADDLEQVVIDGELVAVVNGRPLPTPVTDAERVALASRFDEPNRRLAEQLAAMGVTSLPTWLSARVRA